MNEQTRFLAERLFSTEEISIAGLSIFVVKHEGIGLATMEPFIPQTNPAHSRMVLDAMTERGYLASINSQEDKITWDVAFWKDISPGTKPVSYEINKSLDQAICDAAEQALRSEE